MKIFRIVSPNSFYSWLIKVGRILTKIHRFTNYYETDSNKVNGTSTPELEK